MTKDPRIPYGFACTWWDSIDKTTNLNGLPVCPGCWSPLYEYPDIETWWKAVDAHDAVHPGYRKMIEWGRGKCFRNYDDLKMAYAGAMRGMN